MSTGILGTFKAKIFNFEHKVADCKSAVTDFDGSNPSPTTILLSRTYKEICKSSFFAVLLFDMAFLRLITQIPGTFPAQVFSPFLLYFVPE